MARQVREVLKIVPDVEKSGALLGPKQLSSYLDLYWTFFDILFPVIHKGTFHASTVAPELVIAMATIGMSYAPGNDVYHLAVEIHRKFRNILLIMVDDHPQVPLWVHQSLLLTNYFVKMLGSRNQHAMSQMFHGTNIALLKLSGYLSDLKEPTPVLENIDREKYWEEWVDYESRKRYVPIQLVIQLF